MKAVAPATCGFLPLHLYDGPDLERAADICSAINLFALEGIGLGGRADPKLLRDLSLQDMLDAVQMIKIWNDRPRMIETSHSIRVVPDDRLTAAVYALIHFHNPYAAYALIHFHNPYAAGAYQDEVPAQFTLRRFGDDITHFLLVGGRYRSDQEDEMGVHQPSQREKESV